MLVTLYQVVNSGRISSFFWLLSVNTCFHIRLWLVSIVAGIISHRSLSVISSINIVLTYSLLFLDRKIGWDSFHLDNVVIMMLNLVVLVLHLLLVHGREVLLSDFNLSLLLLGLLSYHLLVSKGKWNPWGQCCNGKQYIDVVLVKNIMQIERHVRNLQMMNNKLSYY